MDKKQMTARERLILAAFGVLSREDVLKEVMTEYSVKISQAIQPLSVETAPIVVAILREYAEEIETMDPETKKHAEQLMKLPRMTVKFATKDKEHTEG